MPEVADFEWCDKCHHYVVMPCTCTAAPLTEDVVEPAPAPKKGKKATAAAAAAEVTEELNVVPAADPAPEANTAS